MNTKSKAQIFKACFRPVFIYAVKTRTETTRAKRALRTTRMRTLRSIKNITPRDRIRNDTTLNKLEVQGIVRWKILGRSRKNDEPRKIS